MTKGSAHWAMSVDSAVTVPAPCMSRACASALAAETIPAMAASSWASIAAIAAGATNGLVCAATAFAFSAFSREV